MTYVQSFEDVRDCVETPGFPVWLSSADESAAKEYIMYCAQWASLYQKAGEILSIENEIIDEKTGILGTVIRFKNGSRITGLSSNPVAFRSKGGKVVLDEFDFHKDQMRMYAAAKPCTMWKNYPLRILSTYQTDSGLFAKIVSDTKKAIEAGETPVFSLHTTTIFQAVRDGIVDKLYGRPATQDERDAWLKAERESCLDETIWLQEYCCQPQSDAQSLLSWETIQAAEHADAGKPELAGKGSVYVGMDLALRRHLTVIWVSELIGDTFWTREVVTMKAAKFAEQDAELTRVIQQYRPVRVCIDQTGMGEKFVEDLQIRYGRYMIEGVLFTAGVKQTLAFDLLRVFEDRKIRIPYSLDIRRAHHSVKKFITSAGNVRFDSDGTDKGHADEFWANALAVHAGDGKSGPIVYKPAVHGRFGKVRGAY